MAHQVVMPRLGWNMEEGSVAAWRKKDGDAVTAGEILLEIESDKAVQEVEAVDSGILRIPSDSPPIGKAVAVGTVLAWLVAPGEQAPAAAPPAASAPAADAAPSAASSPAAASPAVEPANLRTRGGPTISPRARRAARQLGVDWSDLTGSGSTGRIVERDVRAAAQARDLVPAAVDGSPPGPAGRVGYPAFLTTEADITALMWLHGSGSGIAPGRPSYDDLLLKLAAQALVCNPRANARFEGTSVVRPATVDVGMTVHAGRGLATPVIRDAPSKSLRQIARESAALAQRTRTGRVSADELTGATLVVTDLGAFDIDGFVPAAGTFACAALSVGRVVAKPAATDAETGRIEVRRTVNLTLTFDVRLFDPVTAARLLQTVKRYVEQPLLWLVVA